MKSVVVGRESSSRRPGVTGAWRGALVGVLAAIAALASVAGTVNYEYDSMGRLRKVSHPDGKATDYKLDPSGNRTTVTTTGGTQGGVLQFSSPTFTVSEGVTTASITVTRSGGTTGAVSVTARTTTGGTATAGSDYTTTSSVLSWGAGVSGNQTFTFPVLEDTVVEGNETVNLQLTLAVGADIGSQGTAAVTITDNDVSSPGTLQFTSTTYSVGEGGTTASITVSRSGGTSGAASVTVATVAGGTATAGSDYTTTSSTLNWGNGVGGNQTFTFPVLEDTAVEGNETVNLQLSGVTGATLGSPTTAAASITDNDNPPAGTLAFVGTSASVNENGTSVTLTLRRSGGSFGAVGLVYSTANGNATAGSDYTAASNVPVNWTNGDTADKTIAIPIANDAVFEGPETFTVALGSPSGGASIGGTNPLTVTINESTAAPSFSINSITVNENAGTATLTVTKSGSTTQQHQVSFTTLNGTATAGADFTGISTPVTLTFAAGVTTQSVAITLLDDSVYEGSSENFTVNLSAPTGGATISSGTGTVTLMENDPAPFFTINDVTVNEGGTASITVTKNNATALTHHVNYQSADGNAIATFDYNPIALAQLTFAAGDVTKTIQVNAISDTQFETPEFYNINLSGADNGATISDPFGQVNINETNLQPMFSISPASATEGSSLGFTISLSGNSSAQHEITYTTSNGTATAGSDYTAVTSSHRFAVGETSSVFSVITQNDGVFEGSETFTVTLSNPTNGAGISVGSATGTITDSGTPPAFMIQSAVFLESAGTVQLTITRTGTSQGSAHRVNYANNGGTATPGVDYNAFSGFVDFAAGEVTKTFPITINEDTAVEGTETILAQITSVSNGGATIFNPATIEIGDNDSTSTVTMPDTTPVVFSASGGLTVEFQIGPTGDLIGNTSATFVGDIGDWLTPKQSIGANYEATVTLDSGSQPCTSGPSSGTFNLGSWLRWTETVSGTRGTQKQCSFVLTIKDAATHTVLDSGRVVLVAIGL